MLGGLGIQSGATPRVPTLQPRTGPTGVAEFFAAVGELQIRDFQVFDILGAASGRSRSRW
jgi:hypothetical protein